ncbi:alkaline phosphatase D family protein [Novosphingobium clariflavum]|uniref:Alkaline phosphatase D family protein n=1 Tax=Novosphingobium clariflavum TaxID=2029884 RepID=A0ABV6SC64_9SPHN|nr:alkaline phosphatase D family protein [Novosphingobium clariflavum]
MRPFDRRHALQLLGAGGAGLIGAFPFAAFGQERPYPRNLMADPKFGSDPFTLGVASGDPASDGFVIWTRLAPKPLEPYGGMALKPVAVLWEVAEDEHFARVAMKGEALAHPELAHSVHVEVAGLRPDRPYWYRFRVGSEQSMTGRSRTLPAAGAKVQRLRFVAAGCQHYEQGLYTAWRHIACEALDFVFHYGDYIYEGPDHGAGPFKANGRSYNEVRRHVGGEIYTLDDYRRRYALYKSDADLKAAHASAPFWMSFDDHEIDNNWAADFDQDGTAPEVFAFRRAMAMQAYYEHMPLRRTSMPQGGHMRMYREARYGDLLNAFVLDTRQYRADQLYGDTLAPLGPEAFAERSIMGAAQEKWLYDGLGSSDTRWNLIAHQVMVMNLDQRKVLPKKGTNDQATYSMDQWPGYMANRRRLLDCIDKRCSGNVVNVTGDAHRHYAGDLVQDEHAPGADGKVISSEFLATSISSGADGQGDEDAYSRQVRADNGFLKATTDQRGYLLCDVSPADWVGELKVLDTVTAAGGSLSTYARFAIEHGKPGLQRA